MILQQRSRGINTLTLLLSRSALEEPNQKPEMKQPTLVTLPGHRIGEKGMWRVNMERYAEDRWQRGKDQELRVDV